MEPSRSIFRINKSVAEKNQIIVDNVVIMLQHRIYEDDGVAKPLVDAGATMDVVEEGVYRITANNGVVYALKIIFRKVETVGKNSLISTFIEGDDDVYKIVACSGFNHKVSDYIRRKGGQIFNSRTFMCHWLEYRDQPEFQLLSKADMLEVMKEYNMDKYTMQKTILSKPIAMYFGLKIDDVLRVITPSPTTGKSIKYLTVVK